MIVAQRAQNDSVSHILGYARTNHNAMRKGTIVNFESVVNSIQDVVDEAERQTGLQLASARLGVNGCDVAFDNYTHQVSLKYGEVRELELDRLHSLSREEKSPTGTDFIHILPTQYLLDGKPGIVNPMGMCGSQLASIYHRVAFPQAETRNLVKACNHAGLHVDAIVFEALSAAESTLDADEKELGVACVSVGSHITDVAIYAGGAPIFCKGYAFGANHITKDLSIGLRTTQVEAERIKREHGQALFAITGSQEPVTISEMNGRPTREVSRGDVWRMIEPRVTEMFETIVHDLVKHNLVEQLEKGLVLTGGGALLPGTCLVAEKVFNKQARIGVPKSTSGLVEGLRTPIASSIVGILEPLFAPPDKKPTVIERLGAFGHRGGIQSFAQEIWAKVVEPFS
jgi:cell division protein FtsA